MKLESYLRWLSIALFTALAVWVTIPVLAMIYSPPLRRINPFYWMLTADVVLWIIVARFVLQEFYVRGQLLGGVKRFYEKILAHPVQKLYTIIIRDPKSLGARFTLIGAIILSVVTVFSYTRTLNERPLLYLLNKLKEAQFGKSSTRLDPYESPITLVSLSASDNNARRYLEASLKIAKDLKTAGARVMVMDLPQNMPLVDENLRLIADLNNTGIVVFGTRPYYAPKPFTKLHSTYNPIAKKIDMLWGDYTHDMDDLSLAQAVDKFVPYRYIDQASGNRVPDIAVAVLKKYTGAETIEDHGDQITVGNYTLPVSPDGSLYSYQQKSIRFHPTAAWLRLEGEGFESPQAYDIEPSKAQYMIFTKNPDTTSPVRSKVNTADTFKGYEELFRDKIVMLQFQELGTYDMYHWLGKRAYAALLDNILAGKNLLRKAENVPLYLTVLSVVMCGIICLKVRGLFAVPVMILAGFGLVWGSLWLLDTQNVLLNILYPLAAIILSIAAFPLARFAWTMRAEMPAQPAPVAQEPLTAQPIAGKAWFAFSGRRLSLSLPLAALMLVIAIGGSVLLTSMLQKPEIQKEPVYIMSMPTVEVQDYYSPSNGATQ